MQKVAVLLINLGTPLSPRPKDVFWYLNEFLTDKRVITLPWLSRQLLVRGFIVPFRFRQSARSYQKIWTKEGSPLLIHGHRVQQALQEKLGKDFVVELAMRYQYPSIDNTLKSLLKQSLSHLIVLPLFPQYASATTGSVYEKVMHCLKQAPTIPSTTFISQFPEEPTMIEAFATIATTFSIKTYDHVLFSFHGLPQSHIKASDKEGSCLNKKGCCQTLSATNQHCYSAQCHATAKAIVNRLGLLPHQYTICFQSRLGRDPWLEPYTSQLIPSLAKQGVKKLIVFCPSFVSDCLETLFEICIEAEEDFIKAGGEKLQLIPGLNDHPLWIESLAKIVLKHVN